MKNRPSCRSEYNRGLAQRRGYPLHEGLYKLNECERYPQQVLGIIDELTKPQSPEEFSQLCLYQDAPETLRITPANMAFELGWRFLPAIEALPGDGVPEALVANRLPSFERAALQIVDLCQTIADEFQQMPISLELRRIRSGHVSRLAYPCRMYLDQIKEAKALISRAGERPVHGPRPTTLPYAKTGALHVRP